MRSFLNCSPHTYYWRFLCIENSKTVELVECKERIHTNFFFSMIIKFSYTVTTKLKNTFVQEGKERKIWFIFKPFLFNKQRKRNERKKKVAMVGSKKFQKLLFLVLLCISFLIPVECKRNIHYRENLRSS